MQIDEQLKHIGLNKSDVKVYISLLRSGPQTPKSVSRETKITRTNCYNILNGLVGTGLADEFVSNSKRLYKAKPPETILEIADKRRSALEKIIPALKMQTDEEKWYSTQLEGLGSISVLFKQASASSGSLFYGSVHTYSKIFVNAFKDRSRINIFDSGHLSSVAILLFGHTTVFLDIWDNPLAFVINRPEVQVFIRELINQAILSSSASKADVSRGTGSITK